MKLKLEHLLLIVVFTGLVGVIVADYYYVSKLEQTFQDLEKERIVTSNKLATAKIVYENLNHVRDLVFKNMDFPGQHDSISHETHFFDFVTTCINDLKLKLVSMKPAMPRVNGRVTTFGYDLEIEGDFFAFGELCAKFENSRRIVSLETYDVSLLEKRSRSAGTKKISVRMRVDTYRVKKLPPEPAVAVSPKKS